MTLRWVPTAVPPPLGVRRLAAGSKLLIAGDDGSRGKPDWIVGLPVERRTDGRWQLFVGGTPVDPTPDRVQACARWTKIKTTTGERPAFYRVPNEGVDGRGWLTLLVYFQGTDVGSNVPWSWGSGPGRITPKSLPSRCAAVCRCLLDWPDRLLALAVVESLPPPQTLGRPDLCLAVASCQYAAGLLDGAPRLPAAHDGAAYESWARLGRLLDGTAETLGRPVPRHLLLTGDQVYVDATAGFFDPRLIDSRYRLPYEALYAARPVRDVLRRLPTWTLIDDHEISNDWEPDRSTATRRVGERLRETVNERSLRRGRESYWAQQRGMANGVRRHRPLWGEPPSVGYDFFLCDTRVDRQGRDAESVATRRVVGRDSNQWHRLQAFVARTAVDASPRFIASSIMLLPRHLRTRAHSASALRSDSWDGYPDSLFRLLAALHAGPPRPLVFLSGDAHLSCAAEVRVWRDDDESRAMHFLSIHSSALYAPYPFANARPDDFLGDDRIDFQVEGCVYHCEVTTRFAPRGEGFAVLDLKSRGSSGWTLQADFDLHRRGLTTYEWALSGRRVGRLR